MPAAAALAVVLLTACSGQQQPSPPRTEAGGKASPLPAQTPKCASDTYHWERVRLEPVLVGASDAREIDIPAHGTARLRLETKAVRPLTARMSPAAIEAGADPGRALDSLEEEAGVGLRRIGVPITLPDDDVHFGSELVNDDDAPDHGRFLHAVELKRVTARFTVACGRRTIRGAVTTWSAIAFSDTIRCGIDEPMSKTSEEAERRSCAI